MDIVLIPGSLATPKLWDLQDELFQNQNLHHVDVLNSDSIVEMAHRFSKTAPKKFILIGFSMGGYVALELFHHIPERIEKLILINSGARLISTNGTLERERSLDLINKGKFDFLIKLIFKNSIFDKNKHPTLLPLVQQMANEVGVENYKKQLNAILSKPDHSPLLANILCPTLVLASREDQVMPPERSAHLASLIKNSELIYLENCGHLAMLEQPETINSILRTWI